MDTLSLLLFQNNWTFLNFPFSKKIRHAFTFTFPKNGTSFHFFSLQNNQIPLNFHFLTRIGHPFTFTFPKNWTPWLNFGHSTVSNEFVIALQTTLPTSDFYRSHLSSSKKSLFESVVPLGGQRGPTDHDNRIKTYGEHIFHRSESNISFLLAALSLAVGKVKHSGAISPQLIQPSWHPWRRFTSRWNSSPHLEREKRCKHPRGELQFMQNSELCLTLKGFHRGLCNCCINVTDWKKIGKCACKF